MNIPKQRAPFYNKLAMILISIIALFYIAILGKDILAPLIFALLFSVLLLPIARFLESKFRFRRSLASGFSILLLILCITIIIYILTTQVSNVIADWPTLKNHILASLKDLHVWISKEFHINLSKQNSLMNNATTELLSDGPSMLNTTFRSISSTILSVVFCMIDTFFLLYYRRLLVKFLIAVFKEEDAETVYEIIAQVQRRITQYIQGLLLEMAIVTTVCSIALWALGVEYSFLLGLLTGLLNLIPYIGILISLLLGIFVTYASAGIGKILTVVATLLGIHLLDANLLLPIIVGAKVKLNALITIIGVIIGGSVWGITGTFLAIPVIAIIKIVFDRIDGLKPWGMLLGDERDEIIAAPLIAKTK